MTYVLNRWVAKLYSINFLSVKDYMSSTRKRNNFALFETNAFPHKQPGSNERLHTRKIEVRYYKIEVKISKT